jgi:DinB superfamily
VTLDDGSPDPVEDPRGYQDLLLGLLGQDDPAQVQSSSPTAWRALVTEAGDHLRERPRADEWSVLECLGHAFDAELISSARYRWIVAHDEPPLLGYDQDRWVDRLRHGDDDPDELLETLQALRTANLALWARSTDVERSRIGRHAERGPESYDLTFRLLAGHDRFHLAQAERSLAAVAR